MPKNKRSLEDGGKRERSNAAKAANARERNIAKNYLNAGPNITNIARAAYHWYNSVPWLGGQNENGLIIIKGDVPTPGMRSPKSIVQSIKTITKANASKITPAQWTATQDAAIARGDMAEAQRLRDLHFEVSAPNTQIKDIQYHGARGNAKFNVFDSKLIGQTDQGWAGRGYYFTPIKDYAKMYASEPRAFYINAKKVHDGTSSTYFGRENSPAAEVFKRIRKKRGVDVQPILDDLISSDAIRTSFPQTKPYNGIFEEVVTRNNNQMKLADAITYDDKGIRIPLGERDNFNSNDIRYALMPFIVGGTGYGIYNRVKKRNGGSNNIGSYKRSIEDAGRISDEDKPTSYITTGGAGYVPQNNIDVKSRLYNNLSPIGYDDLSRVPKAIFLNEPDSYHNAMKDMPVLDEIYAQYLGIPKEKRHFNKRLEKSKYKPTQGGENVTYYKLPQKIIDGRTILGDDHRYNGMTNTSIDTMLFDATYMNPGENKQQVNTELGYYTVGRGRDNKGDYVSYYDKWDINPFSGRLQNTTFLPTNIRKMLKNINLDFGVPVNIYDRIHFDDYYGVRGRDRGGYYLPEVIITNDRKKHKNGGIHIAPSKRGTFTAAATKHNIGVQEFANKVLRNKDSYSPAMVKKANFARNASKWN